MQTLVDNPIQRTGLVPIAENVHNKGLANAYVAVCYMYKLSSFILDIGMKYEFFLFDRLCFIVPCRKN